MRRAVLLGAMAGVLTTAGTAVASDPLVLPGGAEGCVSAQANDTCTYTASRGGGAASNGTTWTLTVEIPANADLRDTNLDGKLRYVFDSSNAPEQGCGLFNAGATVTTASGAGGRLAAGNPFPGAADGPVGSTNDCDAGRVDAGNPNYTPVD